ncbi:MAG: hypothetical protein ACYCVD_11110 [Desulfitobacteriaceae bacterium]
MENEGFQKVVLKQFGKVFERFNLIESRVEGLDFKIDRTTLLLEEMQTHVKLIGEGLISFREQADRQFAEVHVALDEKT